MKDRDFEDIDFRVNQDFVFEPVPDCIQELNSKSEWLDKIVSAINEGHDYRELLERISKLDLKGEQEKCVRMLAKREGISASSVRRDMESQSDECNHEEYEITACFPGLVDIGINETGKTCFITSIDGELSFSDHLNLDGKKYIPPSAGVMPFLLPHAEKVLAAYESDSDVELYNDLITYHKGISELPNEKYHDLLVAWDFHTYLIDKLQYSPTLWFYAIPERGKSRTGKACINVGFRGLHVESVNGPYIIRYARDHKGSLFIDAMDVWSKAMKSGNEDILLSRYEKGIKVPKVLYPEKGAFKDVVIFEIFGPTIIATNEPVNKILETRAIQINMPESTRSFQKDVRPEDALSLKERLVAFRARNLERTLPEPEKLSGGRLGDILKPLHQMVLMVNPEREEVFKSLVYEIERERKNSSLDTVEAKVLIAIESLKREDGELISISEITDTLNERVPERFWKSPERVGKIVRSLGLNTTRRATGNYLRYESNLFDNLAERYGLTDLKKQHGQEESGKGMAHVGSASDVGFSDNIELVDESGAQKDSRKATPLFTDDFSAGESKKARLIALLEKRRKRETESR